MGGGKDKEAANQQLDEASEYEKKKRDQFDTRNTADMDSAKKRTDDVYSVLRDKYGSLANGRQATSAANSSGGGGGGGGGAAGPAAYDWRNDSRFGAIDKSYENFMNTGGVEMDKLRQNEGFYKSMRDGGGYDDEAKSRIMGGYDKMTGNADKLSNFSFMSPADQERMRGGGVYDEMARTGGMDDENIARIRGNGVFDEFSKTGGYSDKDIQNIRSRANSAIPSTFGRIKDEANRQASISGGAGPGRAALMGRLGRDQAAAEGDTRLGTEVGIKGQVNAGRQWGAGAMSGAEQGLVAQRTSGRLAGAEGMARTEGALGEMKMNSLTAGAGIYGDSTRGQKDFYDTQNANRFQGARSLADEEAAAQNMRQQGQMWGTQGMQGRAEGDRAYERNVFESDRGFGASQGAAAAAGDRWQQQFDWQKEQAGLEGLGSLYGSDPTEYSNDKNFDIANRQQGTSGVAGPASSRLQGNSGTNWGGIASGIGSALPFFGGSKSNSKTPARTPAPAGSTLLEPNYPNNPSGGYPDPRIPIPGQPGPGIPGQPDFPGGAPPPGTITPSRFGATQSRYQLARR